MNYNYEVENIEFNAEGTILRGWLYKPQNKIKSSCIIMTHGYNCIKEFYLDKWAEVFAKSGHAVVVYDNRNFGDSDGDVRQEIDPWQQVRDYRHAITFAQTLEFVDPDKIGIWGTSLSGGHVLVVAAIDKRVKCVVSQVPTISGWNGMLRRIAPGEQQSLRKKFDADRLNRFLGKAPQMLPMVSNPDSNILMSHSSTDAWEFFTGKHALPEDQYRFKNWKNEITLRTIEMYSEYEPGSYITRIAPTPLLMLVAENDVVAVTDEALKAFNNACEIKKLHIFSGGHFSAYVEQFENLSTLAEKWFTQYL